MMPTGDTTIFFSERRAREVILRFQGVHCEFLTSNQAGAKIGALVLVLFIAGCTGGCALSGDWRAVQNPRDPQRSGVECVTFSTDGRFTLTSSDEEERRTVTGTYSFAFGQLRLRLDKEVKPTYSGYRRLDGKLLVAGPDGPNKSRAILQKSSP